MQPANRPHPRQGPCSAQALPLQLARWWWQRTNNPGHPSPGAARGGGTRQGDGSSRSKLPVTKAGAVDIVHAMALLVRWSIRLLICGGEAGKHRALGLWRPPLQRRPGNEAPHGAFFLSGGSDTCVSNRRREQVRQIRPDLTRQHCPSERLGNRGNLQRWNAAPPPVEKALRADAYLSRKSRRLHALFLRGVDYRVEHLFMSGHVYLE